MQFGLSEEQILLQDNVNRFLDDNTPLDRFAPMQMAVKMRTFGRAWQSSVCQHY